MPIYEYLCTDLMCARVYEKFESADAPREQSCDYCGGLAKRVMSVPARPVTGNSKSTGKSDSLGYKVVDHQSFSFPSTGCNACDIVNALEIVTNRDIERKNIGRN